MSLIKIIKAQLGLSGTPANNFVLDASADNGTMKLARGNAGATTQDVMTVAADGKVTFPQNTFNSGAIARAIAGSDVSIPTVTTYTKIPFTSASFDTDSILSAPDGGFKIKSAGYYFVDAHAYLNSSSNNLTIGGVLAVYKNGTIAAAQGQGALNTSVNYLSCSGLIQCAANDIITMWAYVYAGGGLSIKGPGYEVFTNMSIFKL